MPIFFPDGELGDAAELGTVDDRSVRVWVRAPRRARLATTLSVTGDPPVEKVVELAEESDWTAAVTLALPEPRPDQPFTVLAGDRRLTGRFAPSPGVASSLRFGFGSCHQPFREDDGIVSVRREDAAIYPAIRDDLRRAGAGLLLLAGDQIYADGLDAISVREDLPDDPHRPPDDATLLANYRHVYRGYFSEPGFRALREAFPTLMIWDDHEIYDNWGSTAEKTPTDIALFAAATRAYSEYQHARNPGPPTTRAPFNWVQRWGDIAIVALDLRGARDYEHGTMLGATEWDWLQGWLAGPEARETATLFIVASVPVAHAARWFTRLFDLVPARFSEPIRDRWTSSGFIASRDALLDALFAWQAAGANRQAVILSGDVHAASAFTIRQREGPGVIHQVTSSAMTTPLTMEQRLFNRIVTRANNLGERHYRFERHFLSLPNNYCGVRAEPLPGGGHRLILAIRSWDARRQRLRTSDRLVLSP